MMYLVLTITLMTEFGLAGADPGTLQYTNTQHTKEIFLSIYQFETSVSEN